MRKYALLNETINEIKKLMIYESSEGVYVFLYNTILDTSGITDYYYETLDEAEEMCAREYFVKQGDWIAIDDPMEYCQHDIIAPVRVKGRDLGNSQWGKYEKLVEGKWVEIDL